MKNELPVAPPPPLLTPRLVFFILNDAALITANYLDQVFPANGKLQEPLEKTPLWGNVLGGMWFFFQFLFFGGGD